MPAAVEFGCRARARRQELGLSQERVGELAGLNMTYVSSVERGERNISLFNILRLARALDLQAAELMTDLPVTGLEPKPPSRRRSATTR